MRSEHPSICRERAGVHFCITKVLVFFFLNTRFRESRGSASTQKRTNHFNFMLGLDLGTITSQQNTAGKVAVLSWTRWASVTIWRAAVTGRSRSQRIWPCYLDRIPFWPHILKYQRISLLVLKRNILTKDKDLEMWTPYLPEGKKLPHFLLWAAPAPKEAKNPEVTRIFLLLKFNKFFL